MTLIKLLLMNLLINLDNVGVSLYPGLNQHWASLAAQVVKNLPAMWETRVLSLDQEDPLEKGMATHSSVLAWRIPGIGEPGGLHL